MCAPVHACPTTGGQEPRSLLVDVIRRSVSRRVAVDQNQLPALLRQAALHLSRKADEAVCVRQAEAAQEFNLGGRQFTTLEGPTRGPGRLRSLHASIREGLRRVWVSSLNGAPVGGEDLRGILVLHVPQHQSDCSGSASRCCVAERRFRRRPRVEQSLHRGDVIARGNGPQRVGVVAGDVLRREKGERPRHFSSGEIENEVHRLRAALESAVMAVKQCRDFQQLAVHDALTRTQPAHDGPAVVTEGVRICSSLEQQPRLLDLTSRDGKLEWVDAGRRRPRVASTGEDAFQTVQIAAEHGFAEPMTTRGGAGRGLTLVFGPPGPPRPSAGQDGHGQGEEVGGERKPRHV